MATLPLDIAKCAAQHAEQLQTIAEVAYSRGRLDGIKYAMEQMEKAIDQKFNK